MSGWIVYSKDGSLERCKLRSLEYGGTAMGERAVTATFDYHSEVAFEVFDYIEYRGERFELEAVPTVKKLSSFEYQYELRFVSLKYELERCEMRDLVPSDNGVVYPTPLTFSFTGDVRYLTDRIQACLDAMYGKGVWNIVISDGTKSEEKNITIAQQNCWNALALVNSTYGLSFYIKGRTITVGGEQPLVSHTFEYGKGNGLYEIERASDTGTGIVTKLRAYGSTRNLDYSYPKKPEWSDSVLPVSFALSPLRLMLPSFKTDGKTDYVLADDAAIAKYGIREASMVYDDIYPSITGAVNSKGEPMDEIKSVDEVDESKSTFVVYLHDLEFDLEEHLTTEDAQISMKTGTLQGYTFNMTAIDRLEDGSYKITLGRNSLENSEESGAYVPSKDWNMKAGDKFVLLHILLPQKYIREAENRLLARAQEYLVQYSKTNFSYNIGLHDKFLIQNPSVYDSLIEGSKLKVYDKEIGIDEEVTIQSITITENLEDNILPQVKVTLNNEPSASTLDRIQGKLNEVAAETAANGFSTQSELMAQYRKKLDKPFFDKLFVAIDANGNEIPSTDVITPISYIKAKYHVASIGGFTMYAMDKDVDVPSLASGLPFDGRTIWYNPDTQQIEVIGGTGGGSGEGVSNFWDLSGIPSWITISKPKYTYTEIEGTPDLSVYALKTQIPSLSGYATESWVTKQNYATKSTTLSGYGITDAYTKTNVDDLLKSYVTLGGTQTITGEKNFVGGLKVNGSPIYYDKEKKYWKLEGDLLVTGGVTMYGSDSSFTPSTIMDAIAVDGTTISKSGGVLKVIGGTGGGVADSVAWGNITGKPTWIGSSKPTYSYSEITGAISTTELQNYLTQNSYLNVTSGDNRYLLLSGGTLDGVLTLRASNSSSDSWIEFTNKSNSVVHKLGVRRPESSYGLQYYNGSEYYKIWHEGNFTPSNYLPLSGGTITSASPVSVTLNANNDGQAALFLQSKGTNKTYVGWDINRGTCLYDFSSDSHFGILNGIPRFNSNTIWHSGNDGDGSGLEADTIGTYKKDSGEKTIIYGTRSDNSNIRRIYDNGWNLMCQNGSDNGVIATLNSNVASATKLQTARTIWGQSFDGTKDIDGDITIKGALIGKTSTTGNLESYVGNASGGVGGDGALMYAYGSRNLYFYTKSALRMIIESSGNVGIGTTSPTKKLHIYDSNISNDSILLLEKGNAYDSRLELINSVDSLSIIQQSTGNAFISLKGNHSLIFETSNSARFTIDSLGNVGIGTASPSYKLDVSGEIRMSGAGIIGGGLYFTGIGSGTYNKGSIMCNNTYGYEIEAPRATDSATGTALPIFIGWRGGALGIKITSGGNLLANGGITMYSDQRKKTILNHVELSLKDIANAPLIEHYYNSDDAKTTHVGSIAQYWASMNDWFCKLDSEGYYTMEIQNAALASAISIARELDRYETKTDKAIKKLKKRICELEEEVERLKSA